MELPKHDLPTLHRPVTVEDNYNIDKYSDLSRELKPVATPPHKQTSITYQRPYTSAMSFERQKTSGCTLPSLMTATQWRTRRAKRLTSEDLPDSSEFEESYIELKERTAYRYPHPGAPKGREGCMGGTWRHTREAIGYGPGRLLWIDGVVTLYDDWAINHEKPWSGKSLSDGLRSNRMSDNCNPHSLPSRPFIPRKKIEPQTVDNFSNRWYSSNMPQPLPVSNVPCGTTAGGKYKGFYSMAQTYS